MSFFLPSAIKVFKADVAQGEQIISTVRPAVDNLPDEPLPAFKVLSTMVIKQESLHVKSDGELESPTYSQP